MAGAVAGAVAVALAVAPATGGGSEFALGTVLDFWLKICDSLRVSGRCGCVSDDVLC